MSRTPDPVESETGRGFPNHYGREPAATPPALHTGRRRPRRPREMGMKVYVQIDTTAAIKAGKNHVGRQAVEVNPADLDQAERDMLARKVRNAGGLQEPALEIAYGPGPCSATEPTVGAIRALLQAGIESERREAEDRVRRQEEEAARDARYDAESASYPVGKLVERGWAESPWRIVDRFFNPSRPLTLLRKPEAEAEAARLNAIDAEAKAKAEGELAAGLERLKSWATEHGSELTKRRIAHGFESWRKVAGEDYLAWVVGQARGDLTVVVYPDGYDWGDTEERLSPTLAELDALKAVRGRLIGLAARGVVAKASLSYVTYKSEYDEPNKTCRQTEIELEVRLPDGDTCREFLAIPVEKPA